MNKFRAYQMVNFSQYNHIRHAAGAFDISYINSRFEDGIFTAFDPDGSVLFAVEMMTPEQFAETL